MLIIINDDFPFTLPSDDRNAAIAYAVSRWIEAKECPVTTMSIDGESLEGEELHKAIATAFGAALTVPADKFKLLRVPLPPMLPELANVSSYARFFALFYNWGKATWSDGRGMGTFRYYAVWEPLIRHFALQIDLLDAFLGGDDLDATHALLCDRVEGKMYLAPKAWIDAFLETQHPPACPVSPQQWEEFKQKLAEMPPPSLEKMQQRGMFELFSVPSPEVQEATLKLIGWLDLFIDSPLVLRYLEAARQGDSRALYALEFFKARLPK